MMTVGDVKGWRYRVALAALCGGFVVVIVACGGAASDEVAGSEAAAEVPINPELRQPVIFTVTGTGSVDLMYRMYPKGEHDTAPIRCEGSVNDATLPWSIQCDAVGISTGSVRGVLVAQARGTDVEFECGIRLRNTTEATHEARGRWAIAACSVDEVYWWWK